MKNILILTPDRVGSTLLQRLITVYGYFNKLAAPVPMINLHELTNGIEVNHSSVYNTELVSKKNSKWSYYQSLPQVIDILNSAQHPVIGRLAKYHLDAREDSKIDQMKFYEYLNDNFFIISARRFNAFEQAISWSIVGESKKLNVYSVAEKQAAFSTIYKNGITIDQDVFKGHLWSYMEYEKWSAKHFNVSAHFYYDRDFENVEEYILKLSAFAEVKAQQTWKDFSGLDFHDWNRIHYLTSVRKSTINVHDLYSSHDILMYSEFDVKLKELQHNQILPSAIPYKLQTLKEKSQIVNNFGECLDTYKQWSLEHNRSFYTEKEISDFAQKEDDFYNNSIIKPIEVSPDFYKKLNDK